ncbi:MAG: carbamoyltransferase C-terminal domain-containing protein [Rhizonema sp. PD38]|nr:carbamoyltransferase C-terminal domain-containing protein [Rhizonema sp. PD38]
MYVMGINSVYHESSACLLQDGAIIAVGEEERFNRKKHGKESRYDNPIELPLHSIRYCLETAGIKLEEVAHIGYSANPQKYDSDFTSTESTAKYTWCTPKKQAYFLSQLALVPQILQSMGFVGKFTWVDHHAAHAASAYYASPFDEAAVLAIDGIGEATTAGFYHAQGNHLKHLQDIDYHDSLGNLWEVNSLLLGFGIYDAAKVMGLAAYGDRKRFAAEFSKLVQLAPQGQFTVNKDVLRFWMLTFFPPNAYYAGLEELFGVSKREYSDELLPIHQDIAAALQEKTNEVIYHIVEHLHAVTGSSNLCLAGGVALNCVTNAYVFERGPFANFYVQPASHDAGTAVGAAFYIWNHMLGNSARTQMRHAYWGPSFSNEEIEGALHKHGLPYRVSDRIEQEVAQLISQENIVGFFQGRMEIGPRALGNRSLLADPRNRDMRSILNQKVKHREYFRPLAPSVLHEEASNWFEIEKQTSAAEFMLMTYPVRPHVVDKIPAVVHEDGSSRIQSVRQEVNLRYHKLISEFYKISGVPIVLNTSFNDSEPIVCSPEDAINTFMNTQIDYLAIGDFLVSKAEI